MPHTPDSPLPAEGPHRFLWLASYPKSGNTWMRLALDSLRTGGKPVDINAIGGEEETISASRLHFDFGAGIDSSDLTAAEILAARPAAFRVLANAFRQNPCWKVHEAYVLCADGTPLFPADVTRVAFHIVRDPRDVALSLAAHLGLSVDETIAFMADPAAMLARGRQRGGPQVPQPLLTWSQHAASWMRPLPFPVLTIRYEDMKADLPAVLRRMAPYLDLGNTVPLEAAIAGAVDATRFSTLQQQEDRAGFRERPKTAERFFRQGTSGGWKGRLTPAQCATLEADHGAMMDRLGYARACSDIESLQKP